MVGEGRDLHLVQLLRFALQDHASWDQPVLYPFLSPPTCVRLSQTALQLVTLSPLSIRIDIFRHCPYVLLLPTRPFHHRLPHLVLSSPYDFRDPFPYQLYPSPNILFSSMAS
jgi:hypothetical protein